MKQLRIATLLLCMLLVATKGFAQATMQQSGTITYDFVISFEGDSTGPDSRQVQPMTVAFKDNESVLYLNVPDMGEMRIIQDSKSKQTTVVMNNAKKKYYAVADSAEMKELLKKSKEMKDSALNLFGDASVRDSTNHNRIPNNFVKEDTTVMIEGLRCNVYSMNNELISMRLHVTNDLAISPSLFDFGTPLSTNSDFDMTNIEGFPLEYEMQMNLFGMAMKMGMNVKSIQMNVADESLFIVPKGFKKISMSQLQNMETD